MLVESILPLLFCCLFVCRTVREPKWADDKYVGNARATPRHFMQISFRLMYTSCTLFVCEMLVCLFALLIVLMNGLFCLCVLNVDVFGLGGSLATMEP